MSAFHVCESRRHTIANGLRVAAAQYLEDAKKMRSYFFTGLAQKESFEHLAKGFEKQAEDASTIADMLEAGEEVIV